MKKLLTLLFIATAIVAQAQYKETRKINAHTGIAVSGGLEVTYVHSNKNEVVIEAENEDHLSLILTDVKNNTLEIRYKANTKIKTKTPNKVIVYSNYTLQNAKVSSSADLTLKDAISTTSFVLTASSAGDLKTNTITANDIIVEANSSADIDTKVIAKNLKINASSASDIDITGNAENVTTNMSSSSDVNLEHLKIENLSIDGSSASSLIFHTAATLESNLSSAASASYKVQPAKIVNNKVSSGASLRKK